MAIAYSKVNQKNLNNAVAKAKKIKPLVKPLDFGKFEVTGSKGAPYIVEFYKQDGEFIFSCTCPGHQKDFVCYHTVACSSIFKKQVADRAAEKAVTASVVEEDFSDIVPTTFKEWSVGYNPVPVLEPLPSAPLCECGNEAFAYTEGEWICGDCLKARANEQQCQRCLKLFINDTEFAYKVCQACRPTIKIVCSGYRRPWEEIEAAELANPEPEHTQYETSIAQSRQEFKCFKRGCNIPVEERDGLCDDHALELAAAHSDLFGN
jgi:hypothetical protein